jgi:hypothetical protein
LKWLRAIETITPLIDATGRMILFDLVFSGEEIVLLPYIGL